MKILPVNLIVVVLLVILTATSCKKQSSDILYDKKYINEIKEVRKEFGFYMARNNIPGATLAISKKGKIIYSEGMGYASYDLDVRAKRDTKFRIGNVSEVFTSLIYQKMVEDGTLNSDSTVQFYLKDFPKLNFKLTLDKLPHHISGIRQESGDEVEWRALNVSLQKGIYNFKNDSLLSPPGVYQELSVYNYNLLGAIMEKATNKKFSTILQNYITDTLKLGSTVIDNPFITISGRTDFYDQNLISQTINATTRDLRYRAPSQGMLSNAEDLVKLGNAILYSDYISDEVREKLFERQLLYDEIPANVTNGWIILADDHGNNIYGRTGSVTGGGAGILILPDEEIVVAGTINITGEMDEIPILKIASFFREKQETPE